MSNLIGCMLVVNGWPEGAPIDACEDGTNISPNHSTYASSMNPPPYSVASNIPSSGYVPGQRYRSKCYIALCL